MCAAIGQTLLLKVPYVNVKNKVNCKSSTLLIFITVLKFTFGGGGLEVFFPFVGLFKNKVI